MIRLVGVFLIAVLAFVPQRPSSADETYPTRPIRLIVGFAAGSSGDVAAVYGANFSRLAGIKYKYDRENFFRRNSNLSPARNADVNSHT